MSAFWELPTDGREVETIHFIPPVLCCAVDSRSQDSLLYNSKEYPSKCTVTLGHVLVTLVKVKISKPQSWRLPSFLSTNLLTDVIAFYLPNIWWHFLSVSDILAFFVLRITLFFISCHFNDVSEGSRDKHRWIICHS